MAKRIQFAAHGNADVLELTSFTPAPLGDNEVQVANKAIGINYIDTYVRSGLYPVEHFPSGLGTEAAGVVIKTGAHVTSLKEGDRVVYAQSPLGAYSDTHNVPENKVARLPDNISFEQAAASFLKGLTVYYLFNETYKLRAGETFLFHAAAGGVGLIASQWAKAIGAKMIGTAGSDEKVAKAKAAGAWKVINYQTESIVERVLARTNNQKVPVVYDSVGKATWLDSLHCLQRRGLMVSFGNASGAVTGVDLGILNKLGSLYVTRPSISGYITTREELDAASEALFTLIGRGKIDVSVPDNQKFALADAKAAHRYLESRQSQGSSLLIP